MKFILSFFLCILAISCGSGGETISLAESSASGESGSSVSSLSYINEIQYGTDTLLNGADNSGGESNVESVLGSDNSLYTCMSSSGNFVELNAGNSDLVLLKHDQYGNIVWQKQYGQNTLAAVGGDNSGNESCASIAIDSSDNIYVTGNTDSSFIETTTNTSDIFMMKLDKDGNQLWAVQYGATTVPGVSNTLQETPLDSDVDSNGNLYVVGYTNGNFLENNAGSQDSFVYKVDTNGNYIWGRQYGTTTNLGGVNSSIDYFQAVGVDSNDNIIVGGTSFGSFIETNGGSLDIVLVKYDTNGNVTWGVQYGDTTMGAAADGPEQLDSIAFDSSDNIFIAGNSSGNLFETADGGSGDLIYAKVDTTNGSILWGKQIGATTLAGIGGDNSSAEKARGILWTSSALYIGCTTQSNWIETNGGGGDFDLGLIKADISDGTVLSSRHYGQTTTVVAGGDNSGNDEPKTLHLGADGKLVVVGKTNGSMIESNGGSFDLMIFRLDL